MPSFVFEAVDQKGKKIKGQVEAANSDDAKKKIQQKGLYVTSGPKAQGGAAAAEEDAATMAGAPAKKKKSFSFGRVKSADLTQFTTQFSTLQDAGLPIVRSLKILGEQMKPGVLKNTVMELAEDVEGGATLSDAMSKHPKVFDKLYVNMVKAGEAGGVLDTILQRLAAFMEKSQKLKKKVVGASIYPIAVITVAVGILSLIIIFVVPQFEKIFSDMLGPGAQLPRPTRALMGIADVLKNQWFFLLGVPVAFVVILKMIGRNKAGKLVLDKIKLRIPIFGMILRKSTISRFCRTLGTLITSGVPILEALSIVKGAVGNMVLVDAISKVHDSIREGETIAEPLGASGVFDDLVVNMIDVGEETGELDKMLMKVADNYDDDVDMAVDSLTSIMEPVMIIFMGTAVGFIVVALFLPMISLVQNM